MSIEVFWDDEAETVFLIEVRGSWKWEELTKTMKAVKRISEERGRVMGAILDLGTGLQMPEGGIFSQEGLANFQELLKLDGKQRGPLVIVGMNKLVKRIFDTAASLDPKSARMIDFADTVEEARTRVYATLQAMQAQP
jgi:hypothetical protein